VRIAITRPVSASIGRCELTHVGRAAIDAGAAAAQHREYERILAELGCDVRSLPEEPDLPDSVFVEDTAVVLDDVAVIARPGAASRRAETAAVVPALRRHRELAFIEAPGTLEGGDVLAVGRSVYVGLSSRTNASGFEQLRDILAPRGYTVTTARVSECLHLKSAVTQVGPDRFLVNRGWVDPGHCPGIELIEVDPAEPFAANALLIGDAVVFPAAFERTLETLVRRGIRVVSIDVSEIAKAEGSVTCCSLVFEV